MAEIPSLDELICRSWVISLPLRMEFRGLAAREVMLFDGTTGAAEWAPFIEYPDAHAAIWLAAALEQGFDHSVRDFPISHDAIPVNATFPALEPDHIAAWWKNFPGVKSAKVKVAEAGHSLKDDIARVAELRRTVGSAVTIRLDANARWTVDQAEKALEELSVFDIDYIEQPVTRVSELAELRVRLHGTGIRLAADESIRHSGALDDIISLGASDIAVVKVSPLGGIRKTLALARDAHQAGMQVVFSSALETSVGLSWGARAAAVFRSETGALADAGLGTAAFLAHDVTEHPLEIIDGTIPVSEPILDESVVRDSVVSPERTAWWHARLARCLPLALEIMEANHA